MTLVAVKVGLWLGVAERFGKLVKWDRGQVQGRPSDAAHRRNGGRRVSAVVRAAMALLIVGAMTGCASLPGSLASWWKKNKPEVKLELPTTEAEKTSTTGAVESTTTTEKTEVEVVASNPDDALALSTVHNMIVKNSPGVSALGLGMASITARLHSAETNGKMLYTKYDKYSFPGGDGTTDAICYFFYEQGGKVVGGKFDWWRVGGQGTKTLENVHEGYGGHSMPSKGTKAWTMISSKDGRQRSNVVAVTWC